MLPQPNTRHVNARWLGISADQPRLNSALALSEIDGKTRHAVGRLHLLQWRRSSCSLRAPSPRIFRCCDDAARVVAARTCALAASRVSSKPSSRASARQASNSASRLTVALGTSRPQRRQLHALRRPIAVLGSRRLDGLAPFRECPFDAPRNRRDPEAVADPLDGVAGTLELVRQRRSVLGARPLLRLVQLAADDGAPGAVTARRQVEDEDVAVQLRIELAAGVMVEGGHQQPGCRLAHGAALAAARPGGRPLQVLRRRRDRGSVRASRLSSGLAPRIAPTARIPIWAR